MISHAHRCIFLHIPKTGGTSIEKALGLFETLHRDAQDHRSIAELQPLSLADLSALGTERGAVHAAKHIRGRLRGDTQVSPRQFRDYLKFAFVRNPWDRAYSIYRNCVADPLHRAELGIAEDCTFEAFLNLTPGSRLLRPQLHWVQDRHGQVVCDVFGRFERLAEDFAEIAEKIGLEGGELPTLLKTKARPYTEAYTETTRAIVAERFADEIARFDYRFGG